MERTQHNPDDPDPVASFVAVLLQCAYQLMGIIDHMVRYREASGESERSVDEVLSELLIRTLSGELSGRAKGVAAATAIVEQASEIIGRELVLVSPDEPDCRRESRSGRR